jgi:GDP-L-fucose synthase
MNKDSKIYVAGHKGLVGSALVRCLLLQGYTNIITRTRQELDLTRQASVEDFFRVEKPEYVYLAAAKVGGIWANATYPAEFSYSNICIQTHVMHSAWHHGVERLMFFGSSCIYPRECPQPMKEEHLLTGTLEPTNEPYAIAKITGISQCESYNRQYGTKFIAVMPTNLYGANDNYDLETSHVLPALIRKFHLARLATENDLQSIKDDEAIYGPIPEDFRQTLSRITAATGTKGFTTHPPDTSIQLWGSGSPHREFLHVDDLANACLFLMNLSEGQYINLLDHNRRPLINIGCGKDLTIKELAGLIAKVVGYDREFIWDPSKPDGTPRKLLDISKLTTLGWRPIISLEEGIRRTYEDYRAGLEAIGRN